MYKDVLRAIAGIEIYPMLSLLLFITVFAVVLVKVSRLDRAAVRRCAALPLDEPAPIARAASPGDHRGVDRT
jgi:hypothetical protein